MNSSAEGKNASDISRKQAADPFAADIFADTSKSEIFDSKKTQPEKINEKKDWVWRLPKAARPSKNLTGLLQNLPVEFSEKTARELAQSLAELLNIQNENSFDLAFVENREIGFETEDKAEKKAGKKEAGNFREIHIGIEPSGNKFTIEIEDIFAVWLVDRMLGETISDRIAQRDLTRSETAVLEYIFVNLIYEANKIFKKPLFKFISLSKSESRLITSGESGNSENSDSESKKLIVSTWQTLGTAPPTLIKIHLTEKSLESFGDAENMFSSGAEKRAKILRSVENRVSKIRTRLFLGETQTTLGDIAAIEKGDVILIERHDYTASRNEFYGSTELFLGEDETFRVAGSIEPFDFELSNNLNSYENAEENLVRRVNPNHNLRFSISYFELPTDASFTEKSMNEDFDNFSDEPDTDSIKETNGDGVALENLAVKLRVELEAGRLSLAEVGNLRINQIIELGARATDPVNLIIGGKTIARGELVEVEERLGVRIIQILR